MHKKENKTHHLTKAKKLLIHSENISIRHQKINSSLHDHSSNINIVIKVITKFHRLERLVKNTTSNQHIKCKVFLSYDQASVNTLYSYF